MQFQKSLLTATLFAAASLAAVSANAAEKTGNFKVTMTIEKTCSVIAATTGQDINLGSHIAGTTGVTGSSAADIEINCSNTTPYTVGLTPSNANTSGAGIMTGLTSSDTIPYQLTSVSATGSAWGNIVGEGSNTVGGTGNGMLTTSTKYTVYATAGATDVTPGDYEDTVQVKVVY